MNKENFKKIVGENWFNFLMQIITPEIEFEIDGVRQQYAKTKVYPAPDKVWRCFQETKLDDIKVVLTAQDPYSNGEANGLAFDCRESPMAASMKCINTAYDQCFPTHFNTNIMEGNLGDWVKQGVLLLNSSLTVEANKPGSHKHYWEKFIKKLLYCLYNRDKEIIFITIGKQASDYLSHGFYKEMNIIRLEHPAYAARQNREWKHNNFFIEVNKKLKILGKQEIEW